MSDRLRLAFADLGPAAARLVDVNGGPSGAVAAIREGKARSPGKRAALDVDPATRLAELEAVGARFVPGDHPELPAGLADLPDPPVGLFVRGRVPSGPAVAVVGTRRSTAYGRRIASEVGAALAAAGLVVVSGLARGIDGAAHRGTTGAAGRGVAILGCGIDRWYPAEHRSLGLDLVAAGGAVVSEYPPGCAPEPWRFPVRNRLIAAWSAAVVVVEAGATGGALITARLALDLGREVFAVPGDVDRPSSAGCNELIRDGAHPLLSVAGLGEALGFAGVGPRRAARGGPAMTVADLVESDGRPAAEVLAELSRREAAGEVEVVDGVVRVR